jgi:acyl-CoA synthetase (NDP forming)
VVGASDKPGALGASVLGNLLRNGFAGRIYPVNPNRDRIGDLPCLPSVDALPEGVDVAVLAIPQPFVLDTVRGLAARKVARRSSFRRLCRRRPGRAWPSRPRSPASPVKAAW